MATRSTDTSTISWDDFCAAIGTHLANGRAEIVAETIAESESRALGRSSATGEVSRRASIGSGLFPTDCLVPLIDALSERLRSATTDSEAQVIVRAWQNLPVMVRARRASDLRKLLKNTVLGPSGTPLAEQPHVERHPRFHAMIAGRAYDGHPIGLTASNWAILVFLATTALAVLLAVAIPAIPTAILGSIVGLGTLGTEGYARWVAAPTVDLTAFAALPAEPSMSPMAERSDNGRPAIDPAAAVAAAQHSLDGLDEVWNAYRMNNYDYYLRRPLLKSEDFGPARELREAHLAAIDLLATIPRADPTLQQAEAATEAVQKAWRCWDEANRQAERLGTTTLPPAELAASRRCVTLAAMIADEATDQHERKRCIDEMHKQLAKLITVPVPARDVEALLAIETVDRPQLRR